MSLRPVTAVSDSLIPAGRKRDREVEDTTLLMTNIFMFHSFLKNNYMVYIMLH